MEFFHMPIMLEECIENLNIKKNGIYIDGTLGGAGHSKEIAKKLDENGLLIGIDQDINAIEVAKTRLADMKCKIKLVHNNFENIAGILKDLKIDKIDGVLLDLGVSSPQLDKAERGFSYMNDGELDMRMNQSSPLSAMEVVNNYSVKDLTNIIWKYGEEKWAKRVALFIEDERKKQKIATTGQLVEIIKKAIPKSARKEGSHPAKKTFQAIRIEVNKELDIIDKTIKQITEHMAPKGRICIITFHSLEDRIVKNTFKKLNDPCICPPQFPVCTCNQKKKLEIISRKPIVPRKVELENNSRSKSAKLRVAERV
ncbi:16S rRNA (cytosine(1402)-N(4))-methyltransferase RsmH [Serpentinicella sp. ANB-PHB4]|uniref:16S rRNA (cytosine(1402)-N(4))-methyltransferase RsmH n=1 Tax=Serpentinicella sp. ANB-PHB4 TaxID=3074076 RepID=UPI002859FE42|nr:16S rRNA (cytosine(1402)-N(4))-methyltransferase RsmH [Serpentinicella sp. ANB-PHB4]MDR5658024.1 16S rRNA (cytosine(1402)-N(4))-methyltransferase RsmH [Serpentinicella sp. ANB-PHB4]